MSDSLVLFQLPPSPNNVKVRIALGYKGLEYESHELELGGDFPGDRSRIVEVSGQPLTPVLKHGDSTIFDSGAILRYLEANFRQTKPLFSDCYATMKEIEQWEWFSRASLSTPVGMIFREAGEPQKNSGNVSRASEMMRNLTGQIEDALTLKPFLTGDKLTAADVTAAPMVSLAMLPEEAGSGPIVSFFRENLELGKDRHKTRAWVEKVLAFDAR